MGVRLAAIRTSSSFVICRETALSRIDDCVHRTGVGVSARLQDGGRTEAPGYKQRLLDCYIGRK